MSTQHTPGPWAHRNGRIFAADRENLTIAHVAKTADGDYSPKNGDMIAASSDMYEALKLALKALNAIGHEMTLGERYTNAGQYLIDALDPARAAIAKAEGKS